jgi:hypothetical protein
MAEPFQKCIAIIAIGADAVQSGRLPMAEAAFKAALKRNERVLMGLPIHLEPRANCKLVYSRTFSPSFASSLRAKIAILP